MFYSKKCAFSVFKCEYSSRRHDSVECATADMVEIYNCILYAYICFAVSGHDYLLLIHMSDMEHNPGINID